LPSLGTRASSSTWAGGRPEWGVVSSAKADLGIRPADFEDAVVWTGSDLRTITVRADVTEELGSEVNVLFMIDAPGPEYRNGSMLDRPCQNESTDGA